MLSYILGDQLLQPAAAQLMPVTFDAPFHSQKCSNLFDKLCMVNVFMSSSFFFLFKTQPKLLGCPFVPSVSCFYKHVSVLHLP